MKKVLLFAVGIILTGGLYGCGGSTTSIKDENGLISAIESGDLESVKSILNHKPVHVRYDIGSSLTWLNNRPSYDRRRRRSPLEWAVTYNKPEIIEWLIQEKSAASLPSLHPDAEGKSTEGEYALWYAVQSGNKEAAKALVVNGVNPDSSNYVIRSSNSTAVYGTARQIEIFYDNNKGDFRHLFDEWIEEYIRLAELEKIEEQQAAEAAAKDAKVAESVSGNSLLSSALSGDESAVLSALDSGENPNTPDANGRRALHYAAENGNSALVSVLLVRRANPNAADKNGITPFMTALESDNPQIVEMMFIARANMNSVSKKGFTPWHFIPYHTATGEALKVLLEYTDDGWREQQFFYEEDKLQKQWQDEAINAEQQRIETEARLAEARKRETERRARQAELNAAESQRQHEERLAAANRNSAFVNNLINAGVDIYSAKESADAKVDAARIAAEAASTTILVPSVPSSSNSSAASAETRKPGTRADKMVAADCVHYEDKKTDVYNDQGLRLNRITLTNKCPYDLFVEYKDKLYAAKPLSVFHTFEYFRGIWIASYYACRAPAVPSQLSPGYICVWK